VASREGEGEGEGAVGRGREASYRRRMWSEAI
jgi:hypothetical protein